MSRCKNTIRTTVLCLTAVLALGLTGNVWGAVDVDFKQDANHDAGWVTPLQPHFINSILQQSNSRYFEGFSVPQRVIFKNLSGSSHTLTLHVQSLKASVPTHAYDFPTSWEQAQNAGDGLAPSVSPTDEMDALTSCISATDCRACNPEPSSDPGGYLTTCKNVHLSGFSVEGSWPDAISDPSPSPGTGSVASKISAYEAVFGDRKVKIYGNASFSGTPTITFDGYTGTDQDANYSITWNSSSSEIVIEFAGHLAVGADPLGAGIGYGTGFGAGNISGGPYHFSLDKLDGASLGNQDNQIKAADIIIPCPTCVVNGPTGPFCPGSAAQTYSVTINGLCQDQSTITWSLSNNTSGASFNGGNTGTSVSVNPGSSCGGFRLTSSFTCSNCTDPVSCFVDVTVVDNTPPV
ncbi:MAG TPA: hypothetical protein VI546_00480, partial [candidate division Zixibacteria bacterium]|nr:hypothetical protein [candidate division Zixibacteria bacterium]